MCRHVSNAVRCVSSLLLHTCWRGGGLLFVSNARSRARLEQKKKKKKKKKKSSSKPKGLLLG